jgi:hypothetical protein
MAIKGANAIQNASMHLGSKYVLKLDIRKCYQFITKDLIELAIDNSGLNNKLKLDFKKALNFCMFTKHGRDILPTGAPTSPILCNIALTPLDLKIESLIAGKGYIYSRYMDDIHLSTKNDKREWDLLNKITKYLQEMKLIVNRSKTKWLTPSRSDKTIITGIRINGTSNIPRDFKRMLRAKIFNLAKEDLPLNAETNGCLAYIKSISTEEYDKFLDYYNQKRSQYGRSKY